MPIGKKIRFEVFKRDSFQCQYCGKRPPEAVLEVDHIVPKSKDGLDDISNLITACFDCNRGKGARKLDSKICRDDIDYKLEIEKMKQKKEQLKIYYAWLKKTRVSILEIPEIKIINEHILNCLGWDLTEKGAKALYNFFIKDGILNIDQIIEAIDITQTKNIDLNEGQYRYICGILWNKKREKTGGN